jgi:ethanolamine ammonia-lyase large subunit
MAAATAKLMRVQDLIAAARKMHVATRFRTTVGLPGRLSARLQPNHPADAALGIAVSILDGLLMGSGDAVVGINPAGDDIEITTDLLRMMDALRERFRIPMQSCVLAHITTQMAALERGAPVDLLFQSIAGTEAANRSFGVSLSLLDEACQAGQALQRGAMCADGQMGTNVMYFETGQGSALSANAHHGVGGLGVDQQTIEARAYGVARRF